MKNTLNKSGFNSLKQSIYWIRFGKIVPRLHNNEIFELPLKFAGSSRKDKRELVVAELKKAGADLYIITSLDELAWIFNLRGSDIQYNPVFTGYGVIGKNESFLFVIRKKCRQFLLSQLEKEKTEVLEYNEFYSWLKSLRNRNIYFDPSTANYAAFQSVQAENTIKEGHSVISSLKAVKNQTELNGFKEAMRKDGVALVHFLYWLKNTVGKETFNRIFNWVKTG